MKALINSYDCKRDLQDFAKQERQINEKTDVKIRAWGAVRGLLCCEQTDKMPIKGTMKVSVRDINVFRNFVMLYLLVQFVKSLIPNIFSSLSQY